MYCRVSRTVFRSLFPSFCCYRIQNVATVQQLAPQVNFATSRRQTGLGMKLGGNSAPLSVKKFSKRKMAVTVRTMHVWVEIVDLVADTSC
jgi:hypothetical protein